MMGFVERRVAQHNTQQKPAEGRIFPSKAVMQGNPLNKFTAPSLENYSTGSCLQGKLVAA